MPGRLQNGDLMGFLAQVKSKAEDHEKIINSPEYIETERQRKEKEDERRNQELEFVKKRRYEYNINKLPKIYRDLEDLYGDRATANRYKNDSLFICGKPGTGKTVLATFILRELFENDIGGRFISFPKFIQYIQMNFDDCQDDIREITTNQELIIFDDFGAERLTDFVRVTIYNIIDSRYVNKLQTIITSNWNIKEIANQIDDRIARRINGMCKFIEMKGKDRTQRHD